MSVLDKRLSMEAVLVIHEGELERIALDVGVRDTLRHLTLQLQRIEEIGRGNPESARSCTIFR